MITPVSLYAWRSTGMVPATSSQVAPDDAYVRVADYNKLAKMYRKLSDDAAMAQRIVMARACRCLRVDGSTRFNINCPEHGKSP